MEEIYINLVILFTIIFYILFIYSKFNEMLREVLCILFSDTLMEQILKNSFIRDLEDVETIQDSVGFSLVIVIFMVLIAIISIIMGFLWPLIVPFATIAGLIYYYSKRNK